MTDLNQNELKNREPRLYSAALFANESDKEKLFAIINIHNEIYLLKQRAKDPTLAFIRLEFWRTAILENKFKDLGPIGQRIELLSINNNDWMEIFNHYQTAFETNSLLDFAISYAFFALKYLNIEFDISNNIIDLNESLKSKDSARILPIIAPIALVIKDYKLLDIDSNKDIGLTAKVYLFFVFLFQKL